MQETESRSRWLGIVAVLAVAAAFAAFIWARDDVAAGAQNQPAAAQSSQARGHDCPEHDGGGGAAPQESAPSTESSPGTEL